MRRVAVIGCGGAGKTTLARTLGQGILRRRRRYGGGLHADGIADFVNVEFLCWVVSFRRRQRPRIQRLLERHSGSTRVVSLRGRREVRRFVASLEPAK